MNLVEELIDNTYDNIQISSSLGVKVDAISSPLFGDDGMVGMV